MGSRMEQFEQIRRDREREGLSVRALAARHGIHRRAVSPIYGGPLRLTCLTNLVRQGEDLVMVAAIAGHGAIGVTDWHRTA